MTVKSTLSVVALTIALTGSAFAQGMTINGMAVSEADMGAVEERCLQLSTAENTESLTATGDDSTDNTSGGNETTAGNDALTENAPDVNEVQNATSTIDLDTITLDACVEGGFVD